LIKDEGWTAMFGRRLRFGDDVVSKCGRRR